MVSWKEFQKYFFKNDKLGLSLDLSNVGFTENFFEKMEKKICNAYADMAALESGAIANQDESRMVGHYWLRNSVISPTEELQKTIDREIVKILEFVESIHLGHIAGQDGKFENILCIGIGGSALGPQLICDSLRGRNKMECYFIDNTDPDGIDLVLQNLNCKLGKTLVLVISKSGSTPEPRNVMVEVKEAYEESGYIFSRHAVAITGASSLLDKQAIDEQWIERFDMWEWVGGRTSIFSVVGLLPAALQGVDIEKFLSGGRDMDALTRIVSSDNFAMLLALSWYFASDGYGKKDMVVIPYKDRLGKFAKYLQQLIMESLGKKLDMHGNIVHQGLTVYGNKGSTDQHSFIQQLRDGLDNFFITIINVLRSRDGISVEVDTNGMTSGDYLNGFALGTIQALAERGISVIQISIDKFSEYELGLLIALYERAVGFYASMININAYNQPGVESGKKAAEHILKLQKSILEFFKKNHNKALSVADIARFIDAEDQIIVIFKLLEHLRANGQIMKNVTGSQFSATYAMR